MSHVAECAGFCTACRIVFTWLGKPSLIDAACPDCGARFTRRPRRIPGRHQVIARRPAALPRAELIVQPIREEGIA